MNTLGCLAEDNFAGLQAYTDDGDGWHKAALPTDVTMNDLKKAIYDGLLTMMFHDDNEAWGHALSIGGTSINGNISEGSISALGVDFDKYGYVHFDFADPNATVGTGKMGDNAYEIPSNTTLVNQLNEAQNDLSTKTTAANNAKTAKDTADQELTAAKTTLKNAQDDLTAKTAAKNAADQALTKAQSDLSAAQTKLSDAQTAEQHAEQTLAAYSADLATKKANVQTAQNAVDTAKQALTDAQNDLTTKQEAAKTAQDTVDAKKQAVADANKTLQDAQNKLTDLQTKLSNLQNAPQVLADAKKALKNAQDDLAAKQQALADAQNALQPLVLAAQTAQTNADNANAALQTAKNNKAQADAELAAAQEAAKTQAERYGKDVQIKDIHVTAGVDSLADPEITNPQAAATTSEATAMFVMLAANTGVELPYGTTAAWVNYNQALADAQHAGDYCEDVLVSFPDGSTTTKKLHLIVAAPAQKGNHIDGNHVVDANGHVLAGLTVKNGRIYDAQGHDVTAEVLGGNGSQASTHMTREQYRAQQAQAQKLPQTGNDNQSVMALAAMGLAGVFAGMLGLRKRN